MRYALYLMFSFLAFSAKSQELTENDSTPTAPDKVRLYAGFGFGFGGAKQSNTVVNRENVGWAVNPNMSAVAWIRFRQHFGIKVEGQYSLKGYALKSEIGDTSFLTRQRFHFFEMPILIHASIGSSKFTEYIEVGLAPAYLSGAYRENSAYLNGELLESSYEKTIFNKPNPNPLNRFDLNLVVGAGLGVKIGPGILHSGIRMHVGMLDIYKDERFGYNGANQLQRNFYLNFGYVWLVKSYK